MIGMALTAVGVLPQPADQREKDWRMAVPVLFVTIPKIFITFVVLD